MLRDILRFQGSVELDGQSITVSGTEFALDGSTLISAFRNPRDESLTVGMVLSDDVESLGSLAPRIPHYSKYSYLGFSGSRPVLRGVWKERQSPLRADLTGR
jgi:aminopeptidase N